MEREPENISDEQLISRYQEGDRQALQLLIKRFQPKLLRMINYHTGYGAPVEDIAQECWYAILSKLEGLKLRISFEAWAFTIARRKAIDWIRARQRSRTRDEALKADSQTEVPDNGTANREEKLKGVRRGIQRLSPTQQIVLEMFYLENLSLTEVSNVLDIPQGTVKSRLFYAREALKEILNQ